MNAQKRLLSLLLALCMVLALVPAAFAEDGPAYLDPETELSDLIEEEGMGDATNVQIGVVNGHNYAGQLKIDGIGSFYGLSTQTFHDLIVGQEYTVEVILSDSLQNPEEYRNKTWYYTFIVTENMSSVVFPLNDVANAATYYTVTFTLPEGLSSATVNGRTITASDSDLNLGAGDYTVVADGYDAFQFTVSENSATHTVDLSEWTPSNSGGEGGDPGGEPINTVGKTDCTTGWWTAFGGPFGPIPKGSKATMTFKNYSTTGMWQPYYTAAVVLQNVKDNAQATNEYGVLRMDNYGWKGDNNTRDHLAQLNWTLENDWNGGTYQSFFANATVELTIYHYTNNKIDVLMTIKGNNNNETHYQNYKNITGGDNLYFRIPMENAYITYEKDPVVSYETSFNPSAAATVTVYSDAGRTNEVAKDGDTYYLANGTYYYTAEPENTTLYDITTGEFTVAGSSWTFDITMTQKAAPLGGYLYTSNADIRASLQWNIYFVIDDKVISEPTSAKIRVTSDYDKEIRKSYTLQEGTGNYADYYFITVPIRPRLIGKDIGLTLTYDGADYKLKMKESGTTEHKTVSIRFSQYLDSVMSDAVKEEDTTLQAVVTALRDYQSALEARWPVSVEE